MDGNKKVEQQAELNKALGLLRKIDGIHSKTDHPIIPETSADEQQVFQIVESLIEEGMIELYPMWALLISTNNWHTFNIVRMGFYQMTLWEGIEKGCLSPNQDFAWKWVAVAAERNNPEEFLDNDTERYYDILATATEEGSQNVCDIALNIMRTIWEPEDIIEED